MRGSGNGSAARSPRGAAGQRAARGQRDGRERPGLLPAGRGSREAAPLRQEADGQGIPLAFFFALCLPFPCLRFHPSFSRPRVRVRAGARPTLPRRSFPAPRPPAADSSMTFALPLPLFVLLCEVLIRELLGRRRLSLLYTCRPHGGVLST